MTDDRPDRSWVVVGVDDSEGGRRALEWAVGNQNELGPVKVEFEAVVGDARIELREASRDADALVLGARGHRSVAYLAMGSVATALSHHPVLPTIIVADR